MVSLGKVVRWKKVTADWERKPPIEKRKAARNKNVRPIRKTDRPIRDVPLPYCHQPDLSACPIAVTMSSPILYSLLSILYSFVFCFSFLYVKSLIKKIIFYLIYYQLFIILFFLFFRTIKQRYIFSIQKTNSPFVTRFILCFIF